MGRSFFRIFFRFLFRVLARLSIQGAQNIPAQGACLVTINHLGIFDAPLGFILFDRDDATGLVALKHKSNPFLRWFVTQVDGIWIDRDRLDLQAIKTVRTYLKKGWLIGIAPEGTRSPTHAMIEAKPGVAFLADKVDCPIVPVGISGSENSLKRMFTLQRPKITVNVGEPFKLPPIDRKNHEASLKRNTDEIMCQVAALLPPQYRGVYADHPRLIALLNQRV